MGEASMKKLKVDMAELEWAFENASWEMSSYLDLETGEVITVTDEMRYYLEEPPDRPLKEWEQEWVELAERVEGGYGSRYASVPRGDSHEGYRDMQRFISMVQDDRLRERLWRAIEGRGAFRYFKDVLADHSRERERWFNFKNERVRWRVLNWLESIGIEPIIEPESESEEETPSAPPPVQESFIEDSNAMETAIEDLTLLLLYLTSWEEQVVPSRPPIHRAWKGFRFEVLDTLEEKGLLSQSRRAKSVVLTEEGVRKAGALQAEYLGIRVEDNG
jgi:hypothetical protein